MIMKITVNQIYELMDAWAPFASAEPMDKVGLLIGSGDMKVTGIMMAMDLNMDVLDAAEAMGANLIITHHPVIFAPLAVVGDASPTGKVVYAAASKSMAVICAHTNLDGAAGGVTDTFAAKVGLLDLSTPEYCELMRVGRLPAPMDIASFAEHIKLSMDCKSVTISMHAPDQVETVAILSGRGCSYLNEAKMTGADVYLLGEIKHENAVYADIMELCVAACGHHASEVPVLYEVKSYLQNQLNALQLYDGIGMEIYAQGPMKEY